MAIYYLRVAREWPESGQGVSQGSTLMIDTLPRLFINGPFRKGLCNCAHPGPCVNNDIGGRPSSRRSIYIHTDVVTRFLSQDIRRALEAHLATARAVKHTRDASTGHKENTPHAPSTHLGRRSLKRRASEVFWWHAFGCPMQARRAYKSSCCLLQPSFRKLGCIRFAFIRGARVWECPKGYSQQAQGAYKKAAVGYN